MRRIFVLPIFMFFASLSLVQAQDFPYNFSAFSEDYESLENGISLNNGQLWDDPEYVVPIGFDFELFGETISNVYFSGLGGLILGADYYSAGPAIFVYATDIIDHGFWDTYISESPIVYELQGTAPNRIFKLEWQNAGFFDEDPCVSFVNFQLWLYEGSNTIEIRFGDNDILPGVHETVAGGPLIGLIELIDFYTYDFGDFFYLSGEPGAPNIESVNLYDYYYITNGLAGDPEDGQVYQFAPSVPVSVTFNVDMNKVVEDGGTVSTEGVHIAGNFQGWDPGATQMTDNGDGTWSYTTTVNGNQELQYKFINGNTWPEAETGINEDCGVDDGYGNFNRSLVLTDQDEETIFYCFDYCITCDAIVSDVTEVELENALELAPNPVSDVLQVGIQLEEVSTDLQVRLINTLGQVIYQQDLGVVQNMILELPVENLSSGVYQVQLQDGKVTATKTLIKQ